MADFCGGYHAGMALGTTHCFLRPERHGLVLQGNPVGYVVETHASRDLTYFTELFDGIRTEIQKRDGSQYMHGVFERKLQSQLMWRVKHNAPANRKGNPIKAPSWSWASSMTKIQFLDGVSDARHAKNKRYEVGCGDIRFEGDAVVVPAGRTRKLRPSEWRRASTNSLPISEEYSSDTDPDEPETDAESYESLDPDAKDTPCLTKARPQV
ncbi:hypothetical protein QBC46DRAFT_343023 [Diplogelasinospora grovesii]|uniref:Uncharacterized protein n=1 Tax=Diplogelasinospora grovesii TaxID=303347 RepID=A0AAN6S2R6_9PEZI|nr:hypothetical protein QBC46DRAFT_343023 [Diplogelasinospora grovesii]